MVTLWEEIEARNTSAQKTEVIALTRALEIRMGQRPSICTNPKYTFGGVHAHEAIWLLNSQARGKMYGQEVLKLLYTVLELKEVVIMYCRAHQEGQGEMIHGKRKAKGLTQMCNWSPDTKQRSQHDTSTIFWEGRQIGWNTKMFKECRRMVGNSRSVSPYSQNNGSSSQEVTQRTTRGSWCDDKLC